MSETLTLICLNGANVLYVFCYGVRDVLWLRILAVLAMLWIMPYYLWGKQGLQLYCVYWQLIFIAINSAWIVLIFQQRRPPTMTDEQRRLYDTIFRESCSERQMLQLLDAASTKNYETGQVLVNRGQDPDQLILIVEGDAKVLIKGNQVAVIDEGDFVAEMSYLTGKKSVADVVAVGRMTVLVWDRQRLEKLLDSTADLNSVMNHIIGRNLVEKITMTQSGGDSLQSVFSTMNEE